MKLSIPSGTTSKRIGIFIQDSSSTVGAGLSGLVFNTSGLKCYSWIDTDGNAGGTAQTLATATLGTWTTIGFVEKDATNMKGMYEFGVPNALIAAGVKWCILYFFGATNMAPLVCEIEVTATSNQDGVHGGMSALPNTAVTTNASLITSGTGTDQLQVTAGLASANAKQINAVATTSVTTVNANVGTTQPENFTGSGASALVKVDVTDIATAAVSATTAQIGVNVVNWNNTVVATPATAGIPDINVKNMNNVAATAITTIKAVQGLTTADQVTTAVTATNLTNAPTNGDFTAAMKTSLNAATPASVTGAVASVTGNVGGNVTGSVGSVVGNVGGNVTGSVGSVVGAVGSVTGAVGSVTGNVGGNVVGSVGSVTAAVSIAASQIFVKKNTQLTAFMFVMTDSTNHNPATGLAVTATRSIDGAAFGACANAVTEVGTGWYKITLANTDLNGTVIALRFTAAAADDKDLTIITQA